MQPAEITAQAAYLFCRFGTRSLTMNEIASYIGVSKKTIYQNWHDKNNLVTAVTDNEIEKYELTLAHQLFDNSSADYRLKIIGVVIVNMSEFFNQKLVNDLEKYHGEAFGKLKRFKADLYNIIKKDIELAVQKGLVRKNLDVDILVKYYLEIPSMADNPEIFPPSKYTRPHIINEIFNHFMLGIWQKNQ